MKRFWQRWLVFTLASGLTVETWLAWLSLSGLFEVPPRWYLEGPLLVWAATGLRLSFKLAGGLVSQTPGRRGSSIKLLPDHPRRLARVIPVTLGRRRWPVFFHSMPWSPAASRRPVAISDRQLRWRVAGPEGEVVVREAEVLAFLEVCAARVRFPFSRRYWCRQRPAPLPRARYDALMALLMAHDLVEDRRSGASGRLRGGLKPRHALLLLRAANRADRVGRVDRADRVNRADHGGMTRFGRGKEEQQGGK